VYRNRFVDLLKNASGADSKKSILCISDGDSTGITGIIPE
jgi:hypothetical protein